MALNMKDITNEMTSNGQFTRYLKQIDIDNAEGDNLTNLIQRQSVTGLVNGLLAKVYYIAKLCNFSDLSNKAYELEQLLDNKVFEIGKTMEK